MATAALKKVGVEAVVEGLGKFVSDIGKMNSSMGSITGQGNILTRTLSGVTNAFGWLGDKIVDVATYALGQLLARAVEFVISKLSELIGSTIEAASAFQTMQLRLQRLNLNDIINQGLDYVNVMDGAVAVTKEQLNWIRKLAVQTPYDATDIANVFTLARSYGFASDTAQGLTEDISNFAAGMGLGSTEIERIIVNFGQMVQQGKVTQREMNDLARGAFVPVNDILLQMQKNTGLTGKAFDKFRNSGEGVNAFMQAFSELVTTRFSGASSAMARTFQGATDNAKDFVQSLIGFGVVMPILDRVGGTIADLIDSLTTPERWDALTAAAARVGDQLSALVGDILGLLPSTENLADGIVNGLDNIASWVGAHRADIVNFFKGIGQTIQTRVVPFIRSLVEAFNAIRNWITQNSGQIDHFFTTLGNIIQNTVVKFVTDKLVPAFIQISDWVSNHSALIQDFFLTLGTIIGDVFNNLTGIDIGQGLDGLLSGIQGFMQYIIDNQDSVTTFVTLLAQLWAILQVIGFVFGIILAIVTPLIVGFLSLVAIVAGIIAVFVALVSPAGLVVLAIGLLVGIVVNVIIWFNVLKDVVIPALIEKFGELASGVVAKLQELESGAQLILTSLGAFIAVKVEEFKSEFLNQNWGTIGREIIDGIRGGVMKAASSLAAAAAAVVTMAINAARAAAGIHSPSKEGMFIGEMTIKGMVEGVMKNTDLLQGAMVQAVSAMMKPAMSMPAMAQQYAVSMPAGVNNNNSYTNNYNLSINSNAPTEPIVQDYNMLKSLAEA